jgi:arginyl-tRNA synthetase
VDEAARAYFKKMEEGDEAALGLWRRFCDLSIVKYRDIYSRLNVAFDVYSGESKFEKLMADRIAELRDSGLMVESQGAQVVDLEDVGLGKAMVVKRDGGTLYLTRDIASAQYRFEEFKLDKAIYVIAMQQDHHMKQLIAVVNKMGKPFAKDMLHVNFGMVLGMKTRKGQVVFLEDIIDDAKDVMHEVMKQNPEKYAQIEDPEGVADTLAVSAIVIQDMAARRIKDYEFKIERVTRFEGDTGPYLQYAHARLCSIERKSGIFVNADTPIDYSLLSEPEALDLAMMIANYPEMVQEARITLEPCNVVAYLMGLSRVVSTTLDRLWVMGQDEDLAKARMALYKAARFVLGSGLTILGLKPLERM